MGEVDLEDVVLSWSAQEITDDDLYRDKVVTIPCNFKSLDHYLVSFRVPLIEETSIKPESVEDLNHHGMTYCLAMVTEVFMDDEYQKGFRVKVAKNVGLQEDLNKLKHAIFLNNITTNMRIWKALTFDCHMDNNFTVIKSLLAPTNLGEDVDAIKSIISTVQCGHVNLMKLIWGPPGTGKTKMDFNEHIDENGLPFSLGDSLLFGSRSNMDITDDLQEVFLDFRVDELVESFSSSSGWNYIIASMVSFLEDCASRYDMLLEDDGKIDPVCFLDFTKKQLDATAIALKRCIMNLWAHLPGRCFSHDSVINISMLLKMLEKFGALLSDVDLTDEGLKRGLGCLSTANSVCAKPISSIEKELDEASIGVVSPYNAQVDAIKTRLGKKYDKCDGFHVRLKSIEGFQGEEDDIIILSTVRSNGRGVLGFLADNQRTNVALTRARHCLWIVGNARTLLVLQVKQELDELDDLLNADSVVFTNTRWKNANHMLFPLYDAFRDMCYFVRCFLSYMVILSDEFRKSFTKLKSPQLRREILQKLIKLGAGWRTTVKNLDIPGASHLAKVYKQNVARTVQRFQNLFSMYTDDYLDHCRRVQTQGKLEVPMVWDVGHAIIRYNMDCKVDAHEEHGLVYTSYAMENSKVSESFLLMKFYSLSSGMAKHLLTATDGSEINIPFELSDEEQVIIQFPLTSFILGRSGIGKTTVLTMKMIQKEKLSSIASQGLNLDGAVSAADDNKLMPLKNGGECSVKQIFITVSPKLCSAIKDYIYRLKREFDLSDFVSSLHTSFVSDGYNGDLVDFVYIDEVQDLTMTQIALLKYVCRNIKEGFLFAGDTAQTIARGIDFRFEDIRSLFYTAFLTETEASKQGLKHGEKSHLSDMFQLSQNSRTHCGILRMAQSIMRPLCFFFPSSVDKLNPENGLVYGEAPVLLESDNDENAIMRIFGENKSQHGNLHGFGAQQVILVRDDATKKQIIDVVGKQALVLTIVECKGLEFQNVECTYFRDDYCRPMFDYWKKLCPVEVRLLDSSLIQAMQTGSSIDDWRLRGTKLLYAHLFNEEQFEMATMCFGKAGDAHREKWARAAGLVVTADHAISTNLELGMLYMQNCGTSRLEDAGDCFARAECWSEAAEVFFKAKCYTKCFSMCSKGKQLFNRGLQFLQQLEEEHLLEDSKSLEVSAIRSEYLDNCAQHYFECGDIKRMMPFVKAFSSMDNVQAFLKSRNLLEELFSIEMKKGNFVEAAGIAKHKGDVLLEVKMLEKADLFEDATRLLLLHIIVNSLWFLNNKGCPPKRNPEKEELLAEAKEMAKKKMWELVC
ncbi:uncharacterized protein [Aegilops tauschii subsp. strangulata]|uniref:uncharacterized protein n=1 Tax=Aegilops tauschii subsp. strangulata TaxID=200361 RepID=UPI003CC8D0AF